MNEPQLDTVALPTAAPEPASADGGWHRLDPRMLAVRPVRELVNFAIPLIVLFLSGSTSGDGETPWGRYAGVAVAGLLVVRGVLHWFTTKYRITEDQVELHTGLVVRKQLAVPGDRIRTVDAKADFLHRIFNLAELRIGTGRQTGGRKRKDQKEDGLALSSVSAIEADRLRQVLLHRSARTNRATTGEPATVAGEPASTTLAELDPRWLRFAPFTLSGLAAVGAIVAFTWRIMNELHVAPDRIGLLHDSIVLVDATPVWITVLIVALVLTLVVGLGSVVVYVFAYWNFRLTREHGGSLRVLRGLLTTRSDSIEEGRLRGVELVEPLILRMAGGARCAAVVGGAASKLVLPPAPRTEAHHVASAVLEMPTPPTMAALTRHPRSALFRRLTRALVPVLVLTAALGILRELGYLPSWPWELSLLLLPFAALLAVDRFRSLGHALVDGYLVSRSGSLTRKTPALRLSGIIGWRVRRSLFQRRVGLVTVAATAGISAGEYGVLDIPESDGLALADAATPGLLTPFLTQPHSTRALAEQPAT